MKTISKLWQKSKLRTAVFGVSIAVQSAIAAYILCLSFIVTDTNLRLAFLGLGVAFAFNLATLIANADSGLKLDEIIERLDNHDATRRSETSQHCQSRWASGLIRIIEGIDTLSSRTKAK